MLPRILDAASNFVTERKTCKQELTIYQDAWCSAVEPRCDLHMSVFEQDS